MKELVIVSGKGGTGKTSISAALAYLFSKKVLADCDVDAANFHLISGGVTRETQPFFAGFQPHISQELCHQCGKCAKLCRFGAITNGKITTPLNCEGCGVCAFNCPPQAIKMQAKQAGHWFISDTRLGTLVHAELGLSIENSGKLVSKVRQEAKRIAIEQHIPLIITDGPPGIGCPAIATLSGANLVLIIVEPTSSSIHDLKRLVDLVSSFGLPPLVCINKSTLHPVNTQYLMDWCENRAIPIAGLLPYSHAFIKAVQAGKTILEIPDNTEVKESLKKLWHNLSTHLEFPGN